MAQYKPKHLGERGRRFWNEVTQDTELNHSQIVTLENACRELDLIDRLEAELRAPGSSTTTTGSMGQMVADPRVSELRQHRGTLSTLLKALAEPAAKGKKQDMTNSEKARIGSRARWANVGSNVTAIGQ